jgi:hypothetical protein
MAGNDCSVQETPKDGSSGTVALVSTALQATTSFTTIVKSEVAGENSSDTRVVESRPIPGIAKSWYVRSVTRCCAKTYSQSVMLLRGTRFLVVSDTGYGGYTSGSLSYMPRSLMYKIAAQVR